ncbi:hypothetical protein FIBSPDRAFT_946705 [Athelia psychrophila]|uniref:Uncharacterized protein n=1 Tax=Athelia psychrophila TaxID=1759441 RepID=A0A166SGB1_9AGAM|nr:hypothetical protein FIBSPDRAFT_946705 [Fibularhizoctonia sp. CBS 109695]
MPRNEVRNVSKADKPMKDRAWVPADNGPVVIRRRRHRRLAIMREANTPNHSWFDFYKLNALVRAGLTPNEFFNLFTQCRCGLIMTRAVFGRHHCRFTVIDLTGEDEEDLTEQEHGDDFTMVDLTVNDHGA